MELELVCIRHGATQWNKEKRYLGNTDIGLLQDSLTALLPLREELEGMIFRKIMCSDLKRCRETLEQVYTSSTEQVVFDKRLREMDFGAWEGQTYDQLKHIPLYRNWLDDPQSVTPPGGESWGHFQKRIAEFLDSLAHDMGNDQENNRILIVTHGGVIRQIAAMTIPGSSFWDYTAEPGSQLTLKLKHVDKTWIGSRG